MVIGKHDGGEVVVGAAVVAGATVVVGAAGLAQTCHQKVIVWLAIGVPEAAMARSRNVVSVGESAMSWPRVYAPPIGARPDRKSTRLNSSHVRISYAVFCLKKKKNKNQLIIFYNKKKTQQN